MQDLHIHTIFSDGEDTVDAIYKKSKEYGLEIGISDHILCKKMATEESIIKYFEFLSEYPILKGGEIDLGETGIISEKIFSKADYIIGSIHNVKINDNVIKLGKYFDYRDKRQVLNPDFIFDDYTCCKALEVILNTVQHELAINPITILGHCTVNPFYEQVNSKFRYEWEEEIISLCRDYNTAIEISGLWVEPNIDFIKKTLAQKVKVTFGSDCHIMYTNKYQDYYTFVLKNANIEERNVLKIGK